MRKPSRRMPKNEAQPLGWRDWLVLIGVVLLLSSGVVVLANAIWPWSLLGLAALAFAYHSEERRLKVLAGERAGESIFTFARSFDCRAVDTWIIRAAYDELSNALPASASDRFKQEFRFDDDSLEDSGYSIARRCGRSMERSEENPLYGKVHTVRDLVMFLNQQPRAQGST
jgi:hypothetical protein